MKLSVSLNKFELADAIRTWLNSERFPEFVAPEDFNHYSLNGVIFGEIQELEVTVEYDEEDLKEP